MLARDDELGAALELDEPLCEEDALQAVQVLFSRYLFKSDRDSCDEMLSNPSPEPNPDPNSIPPPNPKTPKPHQNDLKSLMTLISIYIFFLN